MITPSMLTPSIFSTRGFSLVEVMVALLVLAIGVLGMLVLQLASLRTTRDTLLQTSALQLATDIAEQVRGSTHTPEMLQLFSQLDYVATESATEGSGDCYGVDSSCTPVQIARSVMREWQQRLRETLPGGRLKICRDASPWQTSSKSMQWECNGASGADSAMAPIWIKVGWPASIHASGSPALSRSPASAASRLLHAGPQLVLPVAAFLF